MEPPKVAPNTDIYHTLDTKYHHSPILPKKGEKNILITSALPYVNNVPHLGNLIGCVLSADVYARYCRLRGYNTLFICGTDEYGTATEVAAFKQNMKPLDLCSKYHAIHADIYKWFDISFDHFGRTSTLQQTQISQDIFLKCHKNKELIEETVEQYYCETCDMFLADRFVAGTCPKCGYEEAKGDQCDKCQALLDPLELKNPRCNVKCGKTPVVKKTSHVFLDLPKLAGRVEAFIDKSAAEGEWSANSTQISKGWIRSGLRPRCITRDLRWGVPVPLPGYEKKVLYVWFDAPIGYLSITACYTDQWEQWWKNPKEVQLVQFMGKDNVPFHTVMFPASLIGSGDPYTLLHAISTTEYLNYEGTKFSKTNKVGVFGDEARTTGIPVEVWRYYLLVNRPEAADTNFQWDDLQAKNNTELLGKLGNYINRALMFVKQEYNGVLPAVSTLTDRDNKLIAQLDSDIAAYIAALDKISLKEGLKLVVSVSQTANQYFQEEEPWVLVKPPKADEKPDDKKKKSTKHYDPQRCATVINIATNIALLLATLSEPYMPSLTAKVLHQLNVPNLHKLQEKKFHLELKGGHQIGTPEPLFKQIEDKQIEELKKRFSPATFPFDIRVGKILAVRPHEKADKLFLVEVDVGKEKRGVVAGLREFYKAEELVGQSCVLLCNLKTATIQGEKSNGMLLVAAPPTPGPLRLLQADPAIPLGTAVLPAIVDHTHDDETTPYILAPKPNLDLKKDFQKLEFKCDKAGKFHVTTEEKELGPADAGKKSVVLVFRGQKLSPEAKGAPEGSVLK